MCRYWCAALIVLLLATAAPAQGVPLVAVEITGGSGAHTMQTQNMYFFNEDARLWRFASTLRLGSRGAIRPVLSFERTTGCGPGWGCGHKAICAVAPDGTCEQFFDDPLGYSIGGGVAAAPSKYLAASVTAGAGFFRQRAGYLGGNVSLRLVPHLAIVADARHIVSTDGRGGRTWFFPISFGLKGY